MPLCVALPQPQDYEKCPIGFGVVVFCIATAAHNDCLQLYERFFKGFSPFGEPNIPIDTGVLGAADSSPLPSTASSSSRQGPNC